MTVELDTRTLVWTLVERLRLREVCEQYRRIDERRTALIDDAPDDRPWTVDEADDIGDLADELAELAQDIADALVGAAWDHAESL
jgi:hypothetical protein